MTDGLDTRKDGGLADLLAERIRAAGPITLAEFMADALMHPAYGYYATRDPFGAGGDFVTAPEISQMFGELIGLALAQSWLDQGRPAPFLLAELGPGRGTLMADTLRATRSVPGFHEALQVHLVETSATLRGAQARRVPQAQWHDSLSDLPEGPLFLIANEFFDALPIRQFERTTAGWVERMVGLDGGRLIMALQPSLPPPSATGIETPGTVLEHCPALPGIVAEIGDRITRHGGAALIIDYGDWNGTGDTLQALRAHRFTPVLGDPGGADLTAHVDFNAIATHAAPARPSLMTDQGVFLEQLGITARAEALARGQRHEVASAVGAAHRRLTHPDEMGHLFKVIGLVPPHAPMLPGLEQ